MLKNFGVLILLFIFSLLMALMSRVVSVTVGSGENFLSLICCLWGLAFFIGGAFSLGKTVRDIFWN